MTTSPTEEEIVARAIWRETYRHDTLLEWDEIKPGTLHHDRVLKAAQSVVSALDTHRIERAGEVERAVDAAAKAFEGKNIGHTLLQAANLISSLRSAIAEKDEALRLLEVGVYPIKGSQPIHDPTQLHAWDLGCKDTREMVSAIAARARSRISDGAK